MLASESKVTVSKWILSHRRNPHPMGPEDLSDLPCCLAVDRLPPMTDAMCAVRSFHCDAEETFSS